MENEKRQVLINHIEKHIRHNEGRENCGFEWDKNNAEVYRIALAALNSEQQRSLDHREFLLLSADQVQREYAEALGCAGDNESILEAIDDMKKRIAELESENAYIRNRHKELDLIIGKNILVMQAAIVEWQGTGDAKNGLAWIYNTLFGPGELPDEAEKDAQAYFDRKCAPLDEELMALHQWFWERNEAERAAAGIQVIEGEQKNG